MRLRSRCAFLFAAALSLALTAGDAEADSAAAASLGARIAALARGVRPTEAQEVANCAYRTAAQLRHDYAVVGPPLFHNFLVNTGIRKRGLCYQWAEDLLTQLDALQLTSLELHWGEARAGTWREHNCVVVTARRQAFHSGIVLDCWRHSGHLYWGVLSADHYPWVEDSAYAQSARRRRLGVPGTWATHRLLVTSRARADKLQL